MLQNKNSLQHKITLYFIFNIIVFISFAYKVSAQIPNSVEQNLKNSKLNRNELEKTITYFKQSKDQRKLQALYFLISNMDIHETSNYFLKDSSGKKVDFNELEYHSLKESQKAFQNLKQENPNLLAHSYRVKDLENITAEFLIKNIEQAFESWHSSPVKNVSFNDFCEYLLPYRISIEPLQKWRSIYNTKFTWLSKKVKENGVEAVLPYLKDDANLWFTGTWGKEQRKEPLPRLGSQQLLFRKRGSCADLADLGVFTMRSIGVPATINKIPFWATATGGHLTNTFFDDNAKAIPFDYGVKNYGKLLREPAKVLRSTYSKQNQNLINFEELDSIPPGHLQGANYIDVTNEFWQTTTVNCNLYPNEKKPKIVYTTTFNGLKWRPFWWGKIKNNKTQWDKICVGTVILPQYYINKKLVPAAPPILVTSAGNKILEPDYSSRIPVHITSFGSYLLIKPNVTYKLFYWDMKWEKIGVKKADQNTKKIIFDNVPKNALLLLVASDSKKLERPFIINEKGERNWY